MLLPGTTKILAAIRKSADALLMLYVWGQQWVMQCPLRVSCIGNLCLTPHSKASHRVIYVHFQFKFHSSFYLFLKMCNTANGAIGLVFCANVLWLSMGLLHTSTQGQPFLAKQHSQQLWSVCWCATRSLFFCQQLCKSDLFICFNFLHLKCFNISLFHLINTNAAFLFHVNSKQVN